MKLKSCIASALAAAITLCSMSSLIVSHAEESAEPQTYTLSYNTDFEGFDAYDMSLYEPVELEAGDYITIPNQNAYTDTLYASGWTVDGVFLYTPGDYFTMPDHDVVLEPVWYDPQGDFRTLSYNIEGEGYEVMNELAFEDVQYIPGQAVSVITAKIMREGYTQLGWKYNDLAVTSDVKFIMPDADIVLEPDWYQLYNLVYDAGNVDRINGTSKFVFERYETLTMDLADSSRISRSGFNLTGWTCDYDSQVYKPGAQFTMPSTDVVFTAVWTPKTYTVVFKSNNGKNETIKISGETDSAIEAPECTFTNPGYVFAGWEFEDTIYQTGEDFIIPGALPGLGIALTAVWIDESEVTTPPSGTVTLWGDVDNNGEVELNDAVKIMCNLTDEANNPIDAQGVLNGDVYQNGDGINNMDALAIQKKLAQLIPELPESYMN